MTRRRDYRTTLARHHTRQRGAVAIIMGVMIVVLVGMVGLALDLGKLYVAKSELQNSADSCALAAARDLTGATPLMVSEAAGITAGSRNQALFQKEQVQLVASNSVTYTDSLDNPFMTKDSVTYPLNTIKYVRCDVSRVGIAHWFAQVLNAMPGINIGPSTVAAFAVATTTSAQTTCALPVFICKPETMNPPEPPYTIGQWLVAKLDASNKGEYGGGNFGWADLSGGNSGNLLAGQLHGAGQCNLPANGALIGSAGNKASLADDWNSRFGIYMPGNGPSTTGVTDFTGFSYTDTTWADKKSAYDGSSTDKKGVTQPNFLNARKTYLAYQGDSETGLKTKPGNPASSAAYKSGADRRLVLAPIVDCTGFATPGTHKAPVQAWACLLMLDPMQQGGNIDSVSLEYRGNSNMPGSPCATQGMPGSSTGVGPLVPVLVQ